MKINFVIFSTKLTGGTRVVMEVINGLSDLGHEVNLITFGKPEDLDWIDLKAKVHYANRSFSEKVSGFIYRKIFGFQPFPEEQTRKLIKTMPEADVSIATISYSGLAVARSDKGTPFHFYMHYEPFVREPGYLKKIIEESYYLPTKKIVNSSWLAEKIKTETGQDIVGLVFPAIDHSIFYPRKKKDKLGKEIRIVALAKYKRWKGVPEALETIKILRERGYKIRFSTFGTKFDKSMLPENVRNVEFDFVGRKANEDLAEFYSDADLLISSSYFESFPLPQLEAMACGIPVVTTRYGTEDYAVDGENCFVVEPHQPEKMADRVAEIIDNPNLYNKFSEAGIETASKFKWKKSVKQMEEILLKEK